MYLPRVKRILLVALVALGVFANSLGNGFAGDDVPIVQRNASIQSLEALPEALVSPYWPGSVGRVSGLWRPAVTGLFGVQWSLWDGRARGFHLVNMLLHAAVSVLVLLLVGRLLGPGAGLAGGLLFAVHPVHVEAVAQIVGAAELLAAGAVVGGCLVWLRSDPERPVGWAIALAVGGLYLLGLLSKESAAVLPALLVLLDAFRRPDGRVDLWRGWQGWVVLTAVLGGVLLARQSILSANLVAPPPLGAELLAGEVPRIYTVVSVWREYVRLLLFPLELSWAYAPAVIPIAFDLSVRAVLGLLVGLGALAGALWAWRAGESRSRGLRALAVAVLWFAVTVLPVSNLLFLTGVLLAERTLYLPSVAVAIGAGWLWKRLAERSEQAAGVALAVVVVGFGVRSALRNPVWANDEVLITQLVESRPESGRAQWLLGDMYANRGQATEAGRTYALALSTLHGSYQVRVAAGARLDQLGRPRAAEALWLPAWRDFPAYGSAQRYLAFLYLREERLGEAVAAARSAYEVGRGGADSFAPAYGEILERAGRWDRARSLYAEIEGTDEAPEDLTLRRARVFYALGDSARGARALERARRELPGDPGVDSLAAEVGR